MVMDELRGGECDDTELLTSIADIYNVLASPLFAALVGVWPTTTTAKTSFMHYYSILDY